MKPRHNILRFDDDSNRHGWRVTLRRMGKIVVKTFSDSVYGGKQEALRAAIEHLDILLDQVPLFEYRIWFCTRPRKNNTSGIRGVGRYEVVNKTPFWQARWINEEGDRDERRFHVSRYGEDQAKCLAVAEREYQLARACALRASRHRKPPPKQDAPQAEHP